MKGVVIALVLVALATAGALQAQSTLAEVRRLDRREREAGLLPYLLYLPPGYHDSERSWPLVVFLHGSRGHGRDPAKLSRYPVPRLAEKGEVPMPFVLLVPQCPSGAEWSESSGVGPLVDRISEELRVDRSRTYLVGQSSGASGVWRLAASSPKRYAAVAAIFGEADPALAPALKGVPIWVFHGGRDTVIPVEQSDAMVAALRAEGSTTVRYSRDPDGVHRPPDDSTFAELFAWMLTHAVDSP